MAITAKELAKKLGISATAVSMALNNRPGVSTETRNEVFAAAEKYGYDFTKLSEKKTTSGTIAFITYHTHSAILSYTPIFEELLEGIMQECISNQFKFQALSFYEKIDDLENYLGNLRVARYSGIILCGTEMKEEMVRPFLSLSIPVVILDAFFELLNCNTVLINNVQGACLATDYLISRYPRQPGYLHSAVPLQNFAERQEGFQKAVRARGMSVSRSVVHTLSPSIEGAMADMLSLLERGDAVAGSYFADNDLIAIGAMKALKLRGYRIPDDVAIVGFDNISESRIIEPALTTINIPRHYMGIVAAQRVIEAIRKPVPYTAKIEISTTLVKRFSA